MPRIALELILRRLTVRQPGPTHHPEFNSRRFLRSAVEQRLHAWRVPIRSSVVHRGTDVRVFVLAWREVSTRRVDIHFAAVVICPKGDAADDWIRPGGNAILAAADRLPICH